MAAVAEPPLDLRRIFDLSQDLMCITDAQTRFLRVSASSARIFGYEPHELIGRKFLDLVHPHDLQSTFLAHESVQRGAQIVEFENRCIRKDGACVDLSWTASHIAAEQGAGASYSTAPGYHQSQACGAAARGAAGRAADDCRRRRALGCFAPDLQHHGSIPC